MNNTQLDFETKAIESPESHKDELRLWLRLFTCTSLVETEVRRRLADEFDTTLSRFDLLAQLERAPEGMTLGELSKRMMVSNGNVTGLVDRLVEVGWLTRISPPTDRRVQLVKLTPKGRNTFNRMAKAHEGWIASLFGGLDPKEIRHLIEALAELKGSVVKAIRDREG